MLYVGLDVGSGTAKVAVLNEERDLLFSNYIKTHGQPIETAERLLSEVEGFFGDRLSGITCTGTAGKTLSKILGCAFVNEVMAHAKAATFYHPEVKTIIDIGGEDSKLIFITHERGAPEIEEFALNTLCAAGTGSFLEQQAVRLGYTIEEFSQKALLAKNVPRIAGRCTVFAKSDMIHLQQAAVPDEEIIAGLCYAIIRNLKSNLAKGKPILPPLVFQGGVAANLGVRRAIKDVFNLKEEELIIPEHYRIMGAIGAALYGLEGKATSSYKGSELLRAYLKERAYDPPRYPVLYPYESAELSRKIREKLQKFITRSYPPEREINVYLGVDVGSVSTKLVAIDEDGNLLAKVYMFHHGKPLESIKRGLRELGEKLPAKVKVKGVGTTGSGRYLVGDFIGADVIRNEITAQAYGALYLDPEVDTIFEIGGQDSKYIFLDNGSIADFTMNKACAAGTGSFLQEQGVKLGVPIEKFGEIALRSKAPLKMGERCTVFMQSDLLHYQQQGLPKEDLIAGLCYSIVYNYLNKVVEGRKIGKKIFFQGAVAFNEGVVSAFEKVLGKPIIVPPNNEVTGAIGVALLARAETKGESRFKGFDLAKTSYLITTFECKHCPNQCEIQKVVLDKTQSYFYGGRCDRYELDHRKPDERLPNPTLEREAKLLSYLRPLPEGVDFATDNLIGVPRCLQFFEYLPLFATFFQELGYHVFLSPPTSKEIIKKGCELAPAEPCFPVKIALGQVKTLVDLGVKRIFLPQITDLPPEVPELKLGKICPWVQSLPWIAPASIPFGERGVEVISPVFHLGRPGFVLNEEIKRLAKMLDEPVEKVKKAWRVAEEAQREFHLWLKRRGKELLEEFKDELVLVIVGRPYNAFDTGANLALHHKIRKLGLLGLPVDMLPLEEVKELETLEGMYWEYGQRFLLAAHYLRKTSNLFPIYFTNFSCGPDSFIAHFFGEFLAGKPFIEIEVDEHSAEAGVVTRLEAFVDSLKGKKRPFELRRTFNIQRIHPTEGRTIYIPYMADHARALAAAFRACGVRAEVLPEPDEEALELGRKWTSGKECYPTILTTGDLVKLIKRPDFVPERSVFFMPDGSGPCRFGQYNRLHRKILRDLGITNLPVYSPQQDVEFYDDLGIAGREFTKIAWRGVVAVDILDKLLRRIRPYAIDKEEVERLYWESLEKIEKTIENKGNLAEVLIEIKNKFASLPLIEEELPVVGVVGEIYVRSNRFANENLYRNLEDMGLEVLLPPIGEWIYFINYISKKWAKRMGAIGTTLKFIIENQFQHKEEDHFVQLVSDLLDDRAKEPTIEELERLAKRFVHPDYEGGEVMLSIGKAVEYLHKGVAGIVNVIPFACMPGNVQAAILKRLREEVGERIPLLTVPCDGQKSMGVRMRLEAFVEQVKEFHRAKRKENMQKKAVNF
ncbi:MAG: acyl-CoA dehydratase activase [Caldimicrobium sp.]|nr:acyl-CoA dehydratase activase [Caldimicrobium sp.]MCX7873387.1 acyl-CoA dehydratase activase [Caldimicrobium sp.]MDW8093783.1 acyl-CoA dehydratase activase [Caldimicrobium sp.]